MSKTAGNKQKNSFLSSALRPLREKIGNKLMLIVILFALIPAIVSTALVSVNNVNQAQQTLNDSAFSSSKYVSSQLNVLLDQYASDVESVVGIPGITILLQEIYSANFTDFKNNWPQSDLYNGSIYVTYLKYHSNKSEFYQYILTALNTMAKSSPDIDLIRVFAMDGNIVVGSNNGTEILSDFKGDKIWYKRMINTTIVPPGEIHYSHINIARTTNRGALRVMKGIDVNNQRLGFVIINYNLKDIEKILRGVQFEITSNLKSLVIDLNYENAEGKILGPVVIASTRYPSIALNEKAVLNDLNTEVITSDTGKIELTLNGVKTTFFYTINEFFKDLPISKTILIGFEAPSETLKPNYMPVLITLISVLSVVILIAFIFGKYFTGKYTYFIYKIVEASEELSKGNLDFRIDEKLMNRKDELGIIAKTIEEIRLSFMKLIKPTMKTADNVSGYMEQLYLAATEIERTSGEIGNSFKEITKSVTVQAEKNGEVMNLVSEHADLVNSALDQIFTVLEVLKDTIEETTFIALNAQIEAARAGAMGRGFMVVASSIRELASKGKERLKDIEHAMKQVRENLEQSVNKIMANTVDLSASAEEMAAISEESLASLLEEVDLLKEMTMLIQRLNEMTKELKAEVNRFKIPENE